nr:MAG TPA: hypothetical protein [Caudoviricetes sp.]
MLTGTGANSDSAINVTVSSKNVNSFSIYARGQERKVPILFVAIGE